jgi:hypothetical protein
LSAYQRAQRALERAKARLRKARNELKTRKKALAKLEEELKELEESNGYYGLSKKEYKNQYKKIRNRNSPGYKRSKEVDNSKIDTMNSMLRRIVRKGFAPRYVLTDTWFFCELLLKTVIEIGRDNKIAIDLVCMAKIGTAKYEVLKTGQTIPPHLIQKIYQRKIQKNQKYKARFLKIPAKYQGYRINMFFVNIGRGENWRLLITTDLKLKLNQLMEVYKIRWSIEVFFKECKQHLQLGKCQASDFDAHIADTTLLMMRYIMLSYYKRTHYNYSIGGLFKDIKQSELENHLLTQLTGIFENLIAEFANILGFDVIEVYQELFRNPEAEILLKHLAYFSEKAEHKKIA